MMRSRVINARRRGDVRAPSWSSSSSRSSRTGRGYAIVAMAVLFVLMIGIRKHYDRVARRAARRRRATPEQMLPSRVHAIVLVSKIHKPTLRALAYARATRPYVPRGASPSTSTPTRPRRCRTSGTAATSRCRSRCSTSPYREITRPIVDYVQVDPHRQPARPRHRLHPRVRRRPLVGAGPAQPERAAAQGPPALHAGRHGVERPVAAALVRGRRGRRLRRPRSSAPSAAARR